MCYRYLHISGDTFGRPIHGQSEVCAYAYPNDMNYWKAAEGVFLEPNNSDNSPTYNDAHDEL